jgi:hypothetical protein
MALAFISTSARVEPGIGCFSTLATASGVLGLGAYPGTSLQKARATAAEHREALRQATPPESRPSRRHDLW